MWKMMLLQVLVALLPVFAFQAWYDYSKPRKNVPIFLILFCGVCVLLGLGVSIEIHEFYLDYHYAPLLLSSLYGGVGVFLGLSAIFMASDLLMMDGLWGWIDIGGMLLLLGPIILKFHKGFIQFSFKRKLAIVMSATAVILLIRACSFVFYYRSGQHDWSFQEVIFLLGHELFYFAIIWMILIFSESFIRRQWIASHYHGISDKYRIEVQKLQQFIDETPLGVIFVDQNGMITHVNDMAIHLLRDKVGGKQRQELLGQPFTIMYDHIEKDVLGRLLYQALNGHRITTEYVQEQGKIYVNSGICVRDIQNNEIIGAALIAHDITELNRLRDEIGRMERLSLVGQMAASITHEIRNPMAVIRGFVQLMRERSPEDQQEYYRIVMDELDRANAIINDFLSLAQNRIIAKESCSLHDILNEIMPLLWADANLRGQTIELRLAEKIPQLMLNEKEMKQLILNLARNGMEAMDQHGLLTIQTLALPDSVELRVNDNGSGIEKEKLERLFEPFFTTKSRGTGLGLPLCLSIIERHGGRIHVESEEGVGTTFIVRFDRSRNYNEAAAALSRA